ncbi:MAG: ABC transporter ATP-binding protein/permease [Rhodospirillales bacterium]|nr:ABC transporter ATP-binding protein/permease [Rhodospirillales bacterium]
MATPHSSLRAFAAIAAGYWTAPGHRSIAWTLAAGMLVFGVINVGIQLWLNIWNRDFFNALEKRDTSMLVEQLYILAAIVVSGGVAVAIHLHIRRRLQVNWRTWLTRVTTRRWLHAGRQYQLGLLADECDNPDGRIAEDIRISTEAAVDFAQSILQCILQLVTFLSVLWVLSGDLPIKVGSLEFSLPGYMVWAAVLYALFGSILTYALGRGLIEAGNVRQGREADMRSVLIRARENAEGIALLRGEADERARLQGAMSDLRDAWHVQTRGQGSLALLTSSLAYLAPVVPLVVALPRYLGGELQLGGLMQTAQAFSSVQWALSWLIDNFPRVADWRASVDRVVQLHHALHDLEDTIDTPHGEHIEVMPGNTDRLVLREVGLSRPDGEALVAEAEVEIQPGERVLIRGQSGSGKSTIMRAIAGVWPWGRGSVELPRGRIAFMPQKPYFPLGTLREVMLYPENPEVEDESLRDALHKVGLDHLRGRLGEEERWDQILSGGEQQRIAFARVLIQKPHWVFMDEATSALDEAGQANVMTLLAEELPGTAVISIGHRPGLEAFHTRELVLEPGDEGAQLRTRGAEHGLRDIYRRMSAASRAEPVGPGFWSHFRRTLAGR